MGRGRETTCGVCGAGWDANARYCGHCGQSLAPPVDEDAPEEVARHRRWVLVAGILVGLGALLGATAVVLDAVPSSPRPADRDVALPDADELEDRPGVGADERADALDPFDPDRATCEPQGCEVWRRRLPATHAPMNTIAGNPVVVEDDQLVGLDLATGAVRWQLDVEAELRARAGGPVDLSMGRAVLAGGDDLVAFVTAHGVQLVEQTGRTRWARSLPSDGAHPSWVHATPTSVVVVYESAPDLAAQEDGEEYRPDLTITVLDARDGTQRWSRRGSERLYPVPTLADDEDLLLVAQADGIAALDLADGAPRYTLTTGGDERWPSHAPGVLVLHDLDEQRPATSVLFDAATGDVRAELPGTVAALQAVDGRLVALLRHDDAGPDEPSREAVALDPDGSIAWRQPVPPQGDERCCATVLDLDDGGVRIADGPGAPALVVGVADGFPRTQDPLADASPSGAAQQRQLGSGLLIEEPGGSPDAGVVLRDRAGRAIELSGAAWPAPQGAQAPELVLLTGTRELVVVRFP